MKEILQKYLTVLRKDRNRHMKLMGVLTVLSVMVIVAVAWQLRFVGIAKADKPSCGLEEHTHTEACIRKELICTLKEGEPEPTVSASDVIHHHGPECYEEVKTLECTEKEHTHSDKCYEINKILDCTKPEHVHTDSCYELQDVLICTEDHEHTASCYEQRKVPICGKEEHTHNDDCYHIERKLICGEKEHTHNDNCYHIERKLICGMEEGQALETAPAAGSEPKLHVHTDDCYKIIYTCGKEEHKHTLACYSNLDSDVETYQDWEKTFPKEWGKTWNENVLLMAQSQMGYKESETNFEIAEDGQTKKGYTRYGGWYGNPYGDWNTMFVSFCLNNAGIPFEAIPKSAGAYAFSAELKKMDLYEISAYTPKAGDIVFLQDADSKNPSRTAIVAALGDMMMDDQKVPCITVIEGDLKDAVSPYKYPLDDPMIVGYLSVAAAYDRAVSMGLFLEDEMEVVPEEEEPSEEAGGRELTDEELDAKLAVVLDTFSKKAKEFEKVDRRGSEKSARAIRLEMDELFLKIQECHGLRYPNAGEADFVKYMKTNAEDAYNTYTLACQKYPAKETQQPANKPGKLNSEAVKLLKTMTEKAVAFETAAAANNAADIRILGEEMNLLYDQARDLYLQQYPEKTAKDFDWYLEKNYPEASEMMKMAESRLHIRALNTMLNGKLSAFAEKAKQCALAMNIGDKAAEAMKLDLDQLYLEMKDLYGKRYPDAKAEDFDIYLKNKDAKAVERYLSAVKTFPNVNLNSNITLSQPENGEVRRIFRLDDGMEIEISVSGTICFPTVEKTEGKLNAENVTANLEMVNREGVNPDNSTQKNAENSNGAPNSNSVKDGETSAADSEPDPKSADDTDKSQANRWENISIELIPVSENAESDFAAYISEKYPLAKGVTMLGVRYQYNGLDLDLTGADVNITLKPSLESLNPVHESANKMPGGMEASAAVIQNISTVKSMSAEEAAVLNDKNNNENVNKQLAEDSTELFLLERTFSGEISLADSKAGANGANQDKSVSAMLSNSLEYAVVMAKGDPAQPVDPPAAERKPVEVPDPEATGNQAFLNNAKAYPDYWATNKGVDAELRTVKTIDGKKAEFKPDAHYDPKTDKNLVLRSDPYFLKRAQEENQLSGFYGYEKPAATLGYILRNYNLFTFGDAYLKHVVGSAAIGGKAFYELPQGGTGDGYNQIKNFAPTYIKGKLHRISEYTVPSQKVNTVEKGTEIMVNTAPLANGEPDMNMPTYLGTINKDSVYFSGAYHMSKASDTAGQMPTYFSDDYIRFVDFQAQLETKLKKGNIPGIPIKYGPIPKFVGNRDKDLETFKSVNDFENNNYAWMPATSSEPVRLFLRMGHSYILEEDVLLNGVQFVLVPPDNYTFDSLADADKNTSSKRAVDLALAKIDTAIVCYGTTINCPAPAANKTEVKPGCVYYVGHASDRNLKKVLPVTEELLFEPDVSPVTIWNEIKPSSTSSTLFLFPDAKEVSFGSRAAHIVAPKATLYIPQSGDYYGCNICNELRSCGDLHVLPYLGKGNDIVEAPISFQVYKKIASKSSNGNITYRDPSADEVFNFQMDLYPASCKNTVLQTADSKSFGYHFTGKNTGKNIVMDDLLSTTHKGYLNENLDLRLTGGNDSGILAYRISESKNQTSSGFKRDDSVYEVRFVIQKKTMKDNPNDWQSPLKDKYIMTGYKVFEVLPKGQAEEYREIMDNVISFDNEMVKGGPELPNTGGIGIAPFAIFGSVFVIGAAAYVVGQKRRIYR